ncbi:sugar ABC transporter substrate-binding protein [Amnibacterium flavum]|uniref:Sugar ABC transporter substrate-binding protein n=1 Tax=Amnibacterium flavum TaxID=2173173 RepID=A0A2V1HU71_9MICO|nr:sugar ABC transporter substrate-binding protein [Amnibacterium flavum]PVZ94589.1 sugar ABC transporter substrate-binding protein [Amnibacterium flavum]
MRIRTIGLSALALTSAFALAGCGTINDAPADSADAAETKEVDTILFDYPFTALPVYSAVVKYAQERADELGVKLELTNDDMDLTKQVTNLTTYLSRDVDAVVSFPADPASLESIAGQYMDSGKFWVSYANPLETQDALLGLNAYASGEALGTHAGEWITEQLGGEGKVLIIEDTSMTFSQQRTQGMMDGLAAAAPDAEIVAQQAGITPEQGLSITTAVVAQYPDLNVVLTAAGDAAQGAYQALTTAGRDAMDPNTYVGGLDGNAFGLQRMQEGAFFRAEVSVSAKDIGYAIIDLPLALADGSGEDYETPITLLTADTDNLSDYITEFGG